MSGAQGSNQHQATKVDASKVATPEVFLTDMALRQLQLIVENDFTLKGKYLRLLISGKGCEGFSYSVGFTDWNHDDMLIKVKSSNKLSHQLEEESELQIIMDPFTAFYLQKCTVDYIEDFANNNEGFIVENENQKNFSGKFWKKSGKQEKVPPTLS